MTSASAVGNAPDPDVLVGGTELLGAPGEELPDLVWISRLHPFGLPLAEPPAFPFEDLTLLLREQPDFAPQDLAQPETVAIRDSEEEMTHRDLMTRAAALAAPLGAEARVLTCLPWTVRDAWAIALTIPLLEQRSVILCREQAPNEAQLRQVCTSERASATAGCSQPALPRLA